MVWTMAPWSRTATHIGHGLHEPSPKRRSVPAARVDDDDDRRSRRPASTSTMGWNRARTVTPALSQFAQDAQRPGRVVVLQDQDLVIAGVDAGGVDQRSDSDAGRGSARAREPPRRAGAGQQDSPGRLRPARASHPPNSRRRPEPAGSSPPRPAAPQSARRPPPALPGRRERRERCAKQRTRLSLRTAQWKTR